MEPNTVNQNPLATLESKPAPKPNPLTTLGGAPAVAGPSSDGLTGLSSSPTAKPNPLATLGAAPATGGGLTTLGGQPAAKPDPFAALQNKPGAKPLVTLSPSAVREVKRLIASKSEPEKYVLRMGVRGGGCSGLSYLLQIEPGPKEKDRVFEFEGIKVAVDPKSLLFLAGTELDCSEDLLTGGFEFRNPNAKRGCGCGTSFTI
jgi:iron-sulfur cluster assembly protein